MQISAVDVMSLLAVPGVGNSKVRKIISMLESPLGLEIKTLEQAIVAVLTEDQLRRLPECRERAETELEALRIAGTHVLVIGDPHYPISLSQKLGDEAPLLLLCKGNLGLLQTTSVGFCGSRSASEKGFSTAWDSATTLAQASVNVVSGYAAGVDMKAHEAALEAGGTTTVVLAEGLLHFRVKKDIKRLWDERRTLVISEFGARGIWSVGNAMRRNKTICGLSQALILIEAREEGGSIAAGKECLKLQMPLFAAVYEGSPESSRGNEAVLGIGAKRLMKSRTTNLPNLRPVFDVIFTRHSDSMSASFPNRIDDHLGSYRRANVRTEHYVAPLRKDTGFPELQVSQAARISLKQ